MLRKITLIILITVIPVLSSRSEVPENSGAEIKSVTVEGLGAVLNGDVASARQAAIQNALQLAIEQKLGLKIQSSRISENYVLRKSRIESSSGGDVASYNILEEKQYKDVYYVKLSVKLLEDVIRQLKLDKFRIGLVVNNIGNEVDVTNAVTLAVISKLIDQGMDVIALDSNIKDDLFIDSSFISIDPDQMYQIAKENNLDLLVTVNYSCKVFSQLENWYRYQAIIESCRVLDPRANKILVSVESEGKARDRDKVAAAKESAKIAGEISAENLIKKLSLLQPEITGVLYISGISDQIEIDRFRSELLEQPGIKEVKIVKSDYIRQKSEVQVFMTPDFQPKLGDLLIHLASVELSIIKAVSNTYILEVLE